MTQKQQTDLAIRLITKAITANLQTTLSVQVIYDGDSNWVEILIYSEKGSLETLFHETVDLDKYDAEMIDLVEEMFDSILETGVFPINQ